ncbi:hypothetical protein HN011_012420 [Eciton burchellii]|nr:hypothetical protein HN011_012420 [Eciton burchellii]
MDINITEQEEEQEEEEEERTCVRSVMTYAIGTKAETTKHLLRKTEMRILMCISGNTPRNRIRRRHPQHLQDSRWDRIRRRAWRDHVNRMDDNRLAKIPENKKPNIPRPPERSLKRWCES